MTKRKISVISILTTLLVAAAVILIVIGKPLDGTSAPAAENHQVTDVKLKTGKYYFKGDVSSDFYIEVTDDSKIRSGGEGQRERLEEYLKTVQPELELSDVGKAAEDMIQTYGKSNDYILYYFADLDQTSIFISWQLTDDGATGYGYKLIDENTIEWISTGDFIYIP